MTASVIVCDEAVEYDCCNPRPRFTAPTVEFITERRYGWTQEQLAHALTGRNVASGKLRLSVAVRNRHNGMVRFDADLFKLDYDLSLDAIARLYRHWHDLNAAYSLPKKVLRRMDCHFSKTTIIFDATTEQAEQWREFLKTALSDASSYVGIGLSKTGAHCRIERQ